MAHQLVPRFLTASLAAVATLGLVVGCAGTGDSNSSSDSSSDDASSFADDYPADTAIVHIEQTGGFVTPQTNFSRVPDVVLYADGRSIAAGPQIMIYPPPALPNLQLGSVTDAQLEGLIDDADAAGLLTDDVDYGEPAVADANTTVVTIRVGDTSYVHEAYALDQADVSAAEARANLSAFIAEAYSVAGSAQSSAWEPESYSLLAIPATDEDSGTDDTGDTGDTGDTDDTDDTDTGTGTGTDTDTGDVTLDPPVPWNVEGVDLAEATSCVEITGDAAGALREELSTANMLTRFDEDGTTYELWVRPILPGEIPCEAEE